MQSKKKARSHMQLAIPLVLTSRYLNRHLFMFRQMSTYNQEYNLKCGDAKFKHDLRTYPLSRCGNWVWYTSVFQQLFNTLLLYCLVIPSIKNHCIDFYCYSYFSFFTLSFYYKCPFQHFVASKCPSVGQKTQYLGGIFKT